MVMVVCFVFRAERPTLNVVNVVLDDTARIVDSASQVHVRIYT
jgi:hypothetical protein